MTASLVLQVCKQKFRHWLHLTTYLLHLIPKNKVNKQCKKSLFVIGIVIASNSCETTEYTEKQWLLFGVHSIMKVKLDQAGEGGGCTPTPYHYIYHHQ
jgi:hypothetical protein